MSEVSTSFEGAVAHLRIERPHKRNAISDGVIQDLEQAFLALPASCRAVVISGQGEHFCAGLDLSEIKGRTSVEGLHHSRQWHRVFDMMEKGTRPIVAAIHGACVGGGMEPSASGLTRGLEQCPSRQRWDPNVVIQVFTEHSGSGPACRVPSGHVGSALGAVTLTSITPARSSAPRRRGNRSPT